MYQLQVFHGDHSHATETCEVKRASEVLELIPTLLKRHEDCAKIVVSTNGARLFAVDCAGDLLPS